MAILDNTTIQGHLNVFGEIDGTTLSENGVKLINKYAQKSGTYPNLIAGGIQDHTNKDWTFIPDYAGNNATSNRWLCVFERDGNNVYLKATESADLPISTATQTALDEKVNKAGDIMSGQLTMGPGTEIHANEHIIFDGQSNPYIKMISGGTPYYFQAADGEFGLGPTWDKATRWNKDGDMTIYGNSLTLGKNGKLRLWEDSEGGNIKISSPDTTSTGEPLKINWQLDAYNGNLRFFTEDEKTFYSLPRNINPNSPLFATIATEAEVATRVPMHTASSYNCNELYDTGTYCVAGGSGVPDGVNYGTLFVQAYRKPLGNTTTDFATQIYIPNGDNWANQMWFRTSKGNSWDDWKRIAVSDEINSSCKIYQLDSVDKLPQTDVNQGDISIVTTVITGDKKSISTYVYDNTSKWVAADGNYSADNIYFSDDIVFTESVGTVKVPSSGSIIVPAKGITVNNFLKNIFAKEINTNLVTSQPSLTVKSNCAESIVEVGTTIIPKATTSFYAGSYKYGPDTGCVASNYKISSVTVPSETSNASTATFNNYKFTSENSTYQVKAECTTSEGVAPKSNIGKEYPGQKIIKHNIVANNTTICTAKYYEFYGYIANKQNKVPLTTAGLTNQVIRNLQEHNWSEYSPQSIYTIPEKWIQFIYAVPANKQSSMNAKDGNNITFTVKKITNCKINLPDGTKKDYDVFVIDNAAQYSATSINMSWN